MIVLKVCTVEDSFLGFVLPICMLMLKKMHIKVTSRGGELWPCLSWGLCMNYGWPFHVELGKRAKVSLAVA